MVKVSPESGRAVKAQGARFIRLERTGLTMPSLGVNALTSFTFNHTALPSPIFSYNVRIPITGGYYYRWDHDRTTESREHYISSGAGTNSTSTVLSSYRGFTGTFDFIAYIMDVN